MINGSLITVCVKTKGRRDYVILMTHQQPPLKTMFTSMLNRPPLVFTFRKRTCAYLNVIYIKAYTIHVQYFTLHTHNVKLCCQVYCTRYLRPNTLMVMKTKISIKSQVILKNFSVLILSKQCLPKIGT